MIGSAPGAGATIERGGEVVLVVSLGPPLVKVPDISGADSLEEAIDILRAKFAGRGVRARRGVRPAPVPAPAPRYRRAQPSTSSCAARVATDEMLPKFHDLWLFFHPPGRCAGRGDPQPLRRGHRPGFLSSLALDQSLTSRVKPLSP